VGFDRSLRYGLLLPETVQLLTSYAGCKVIRRQRVYVLCLGRKELACGSQAFIATLLFDPSMSALPIIPKQNSALDHIYTSGNKLIYYQLTELRENVKAIAILPLAEWVDIIHSLYNSHGSISKRHAPWYLSSLSLSVPRRHSHHSMDPCDALLSSPSLASPSLGPYSIFSAFHPDPSSPHDGLRIPN
jgi:hypothetical protein